MSREVLVFALVAAANAILCCTLSKGLPFAALRDWLKSGFPALHSIVECPFCLAHWTSVVFVWWVPRFGQPLIISWLALIWATVILSGLVFLVPPMKFHYPYK